MNSPTLHLSTLNTTPIERIEEGDTTVRYANISLLSEGIWTDQKSKTPTLYPTEAFENVQARYDESEFDGPPVNEMHDVHDDTGEVNQTSLAGYVDPDSLTVNGRVLMGDIVLDTSLAAGAMADERLQDSLESGGKVGYGGPSVELDIDPEDIGPSEHPQAAKEIEAGYLTGLGLVSNQADKNIGFDNETRNRAVALADDGQDVMRLERERHAMNLDPEQVRSKLENLGVELSDDVTDDELEAFAQNLLEDGDDEEEEDEEEEEEVENEEDEEEADPEDEEEDEETEMSDDELVQTVQALQERVQNLEDMAESMMAAEDLEESLEEFEQDLADAETVSELSEAKEDLEKRLSELEDEPKEPRSLADADDGESDGFEGSPQFVGEFDSRRRTYSR